MAPNLARVGSQNNNGERENNIKIAIDVGKHQLGVLPKGFRADLVAAPDRQTMMRECDHKNVSARALLVRRVGQIVSAWLVRSHQ
ncbi:MAG: hypothetical protein ACI9BW_001336 [Gammaproteobacteria bacterium]|jgi:hypothetical protein